MDKTVILLIDFIGHDILAGEYVKNLRYSTLQSILQEPHDKDKNIVVSIGSSCWDPKLKEMKTMAIHDKWKWLEIVNDKADVETIEKQVKEKLNFHMNNTDTRILIGGCNTSGCVLKSKLSSAKYFSKKYNTTILLPMCAEYQAHGINDIEKNMRAFARIFRYAKKEKLDINVAEFDDLMTY